MALGHTTPDTLRFMESLRSRILRTPGTIFASASTMPVHSTACLCRTPVVEDNYTIVRSQNCANIQSVVCDIMTRGELTR